MLPGARRHRLHTIDTANPATTTKKNETNDSKFFPRCEYKARFKETSTYEMSDPLFWGTYYRSTKRGGNYDRLNTIKPDMVPVPQKITKRRASSGIFHSPYARSQYTYHLRSSVTQRSSESTNANNGFLYDKQLKYKCKLCNIVVDKCKTLVPQRLTVYVQNDFPCILVELNLLRDKLGEKVLYEICSAYFCAIANFFAIKNKIPIEMVLRASIGHNLATISATKISFRINIGIVPTVYATNVLFESIQWLNDNYENILSESLSLSVEQIQRINSGIRAYNAFKKTKSRNPKLLVAWNPNETILETLCKRGDSSGRSVAVQITRLNQYVDLLCDYAHAESRQNLDELQLSGKPLRQMLSKYCFHKNQVKMSVRDEDYAQQQLNFPKHENGQIKSDTEFWEIITCVAFAINMSNVVGTKKVYALHGMLEKANSKFINNCPQICDGGYGSDSDGEGCIDFGTKLEHWLAIENKVPCYCRKVVVQTGMRAINLAYALAKCLTETKKACTKHMYYETRDAIKNASDQITINNLDFPKSKQKLIRFIDLNFCANTPKNTSKVDLERIKKNCEKAKEKEQVIVFDYTSATSDKIKEALRLFIPQMKVLLLVNSGSKNEQIGADKNPYGTVRVVCTDLNLLNELYSGLIKTLDSKMERLPKQLHNIRKAYKSTGAVLTYKAIFNKDWKPRAELLNSTV